MKHAAVYKYLLPFPSGSAELPVVTISMPRGARVLLAAVQHEEPRVWAAVDPDEPLAEKRLLVIGTGWEVAGLDLSEWEHRGTVMLAGGRLVYHVFEEVTH